jgi:hypothetical protein
VRDPEQNSRERDRDRADERGQGRPVVERPRHPARLAAAPTASPAARRRRSGGSSERATAFDLPQDHLVGELTRLGARSSVREPSGRTAPAATEQRQGSDPRPRAAAARRLSPRGHAPRRAKGPVEASFAPRSWNEVRGLCRSRERACGQAWRRR